ncbi:DUF3426 domain-containing protein [Marinobacter sp. CHS3-4]|uniref:DUF3426 domain-containing protein n=1 Tax=Marinobacter sp. CHS3-4 TaxID=3045174 RepID=UPI0024B4D4BA|nr:DUF3426 domain-containing protein [Marinobacter sp. CHS3-4]MDI9244297.1 DUF3426 domain-containing protein [Marinobacter sp. CHS3-4]
MTQSSLQTQCPKCDTRFRVTDAQLGVANGKVRCGNCMSVFNALEHRIDESTSPAPEKQPEAAPQDQDSETTSSEEDFVFADNPEEDAAESTYTGTKLTFSDDELSDSFRSVDEPGKTSAFGAEDEDDSENTVDESWAEDILSDDDAPASEPEPTAPSKPEPKPQPNSKPDPEPQTKAKEESAPPKAPEPAPKPEPEPEPEPRTDDYDGFFIDEPESSDFDYDLDEPEPDNGPRVSESPYQNLRREPIGVSGGGSGRLRGVLWFLVVVALIGALVSQVVWFQFDRLSAIPQLRPFYEKGCEMFDCELKPLIDVQSIQSRKLVVKTNPENRSQLIVDAVIINRASFEQPFPAIALTFANLNNDVVAQSVFTPEEYLAGDGKDLEAMPIDTPVRIVINIRDPGKDAVNYNIAFRAHSP